jgi:flagellar hook-length control protein FliK
VDTGPAPAHARAAGTAATAASDFDSLLDGARARQSASFDKSNQNRHVVHERDRRPASAAGAEAAHPAAAKPARTDSGDSRPVANGRPTNHNRIARADTPAQRVPDEGADPAAKPPDPQAPSESAGNQTAAGQAQVVAADAERPIVQQVAVVAAVISATVAEPPADADAAQASVESPTATARADSQNVVGGSSRPGPVPAGIADPGVSATAAATAPLLGFVAGSPAPPATQVDLQDVPPAEDAAESAGQAAPSTGAMKAESRKIGLSGSATDAWWRGQPHLDGVDGETTSAAGSSWLPRADQLPQVKGRPGLDSPTTEELPTLPASAGLETSGAPEPSDDLAGFVTMRRAPARPSAVGQSGMTEATAAQRAARMMVMAAVAEAGRQTGQATDTAPVRETPATPSVFGAPAITAVGMAEGMEPGARRTQDLFADPSQFASLGGDSQQRVRLVEQAYAASGTGRDSTSQRNPEPTPLAPAVHDAGSAAAAVMSLPPTTMPSSDPAIAGGATVAPAGGGAEATPDPPIAGQVVRAISMAWRDGVGEAKVRLTPEHLGEVTVSLRVERGQVTAHVQADTATAREWIQAHEVDLRQGLEGQGLQLARLVVTADGHRQRQDGGKPQPQPRRAPSRGGESQARFEVDA